MLSAKTIKILKLRLSNTETVNKVPSSFQFKLWLTFANKLFGQIMFKEFHWQQKKFIFIWAFLSCDSLEIELRDWEINEC